MYVRYDDAAVFAAVGARYFSGLDAGDFAAGSDRAVYQAAEMLNRQIAGRQPPGPFHKGLYHVCEFVHSDFAGRIAEADGAAHKQRRVGPQNVGGKAVVLRQRDIRQMP